VIHGYGGSWTCQLPAGNNFQQISKIDESGPHPTTFEINVMILLSDRDSVRCRNNVTMDIKLLMPGT